MNESKESYGQWRTDTGWTSPRATVVSLRLRQAHTWTNIHTREKLNAWSTIYNVIYPIFIYQFQQYFLKFERKIYIWSETMSNKIFRPYLSEQFWILTFFSYFTYFGWKFKFSILNMLRHKYVNTYFDRRFLILS